MANTQDLSTAVAQRAATTRQNRANGGQPGATLQEVADPGATLRADIERMGPEFAKAMPKGLEAQQLVRDALTAVRTVKHLDQCDTPSVLGALMTIAQLGLRCNVLGQAYVLPYYSKRDKAYHAQFVLGYPGMVELAHRSDKVTDISFRPVYEADTFDIDYGSGVIKHKPNLRGKRGKAYGFYALVRYVNGGSSWFYMSREDAEDYRDLYATSRNREGAIVGPWRDNFDAMAAKSCLRQLSKFIPKSPELATALAADEGLRLDFAPDGDAASATTGLDVVDGEVVERDNGDLPPEPPDDGNA